MYSFIQNTDRDGLDYGHILSLEFHYHIGPSLTV